MVKFAFFFVVTALLWASRGAMGAERFNLIPPEAEWRYHAGGVDLGMAWHQPNYVEGDGWVIGRQLFGEDVSSYPLEFQTPLPKPHPLTTYFRRPFVFSGDPRRTLLVLSNLVEDGAVFYLNGAPLARLRVPADPTFITTTAGAALEPHPGWEVLTVVPTNLVQGINLLAVELHQAGTGSSDAAFALVLDAEAVEPIVFVNQPQDTTVAEGSRLELSVGATGPQVRYQWFRDGVALRDATNAVVSFANALPAMAGNYFVTAINAFDSVTSRWARVIVQPDTNGPTIVHAGVPISSFSPARATNVLVVLFSENVGVTSARDTNNYALVRRDGGQSLMVTQAVTSRMQVQLRLNEFIHPGEEYILSVSGVADTRGNLIRPDSRIGVAFPREVVPVGALWRWEDSGRDLGTAWRERDFDDSQWPEGPGAFYFSFFPGSLDLCGAAANTALTWGAGTYYFRTRFTVQTLDGVGLLRIQAAVDDGAVAYVNGVEYHRFNMPVGDVHHGASAPQRIVVASCDRWSSFYVTNLVSGENVLAVEVHQEQSDLTADVVFGLQAYAAIAPVLPELIEIAIQPAGPGPSAVVRWGPPGTVLQSAPALDGPWDDVAGQSPWTLTPTNRAAFFRVRSR